jgi:hypothetical protein
MGSWIKCECGERLHMNLFAGAGLRLLIREELLDRDFAGVTARQLVDELVVTAAETVVTCTACGRLHIEARDGSIRAYLPMPPAR